MSTTIRTGARLARHACAVLAAGALLAGCATRPQPPAGTAALSATSATSADTIMTQAAHAYTGRFSVRYDDRLGKQQNVYGNFDWQETGNVITLELRSPLGQTLAVVRSSPQRASLEMPGRAPRFAGDVGQLMQDTLGFSLPLDGLRYWMLPRPSPGSPADITGDASHPKQIRQDGWTIDYRAYADAPATGVRRLDLTRAEPPLDIKLVLDR
ncbi:lipoprotein insertase outer membrane protein LolB [Burkholderia glumae]|uniref:Outer-membrane lipoprotein LolB n=1 Tax=Burkholderia glumae TaxID=337 RepID=A0AAP9Y0P7_BURGL|nr:lipoprotein insertase outer membrane protein LolB [Burkholderia glumae]AJY65181.1 outer membrane lipoprotein LolB [Burkholderia glumae LMG 2196 = ATCC 33617]MCM2482162.1 lipoprotein insertase outer membrane protein LolB [Burkholderia glumae]MCM2507695.1 lipoprotein insertase outer membrane protein LolB [Burkholderia glumae]MCM2536367.1 lipoprotein insertase outer membrane protein LolB [Burkholderia glumae]MCR1768861.1 lipoprotein localization protein LolB [Burkholderia glumae]